MKILLISSGYNGGIYDYFETWITSEFKKNHEVHLFKISDGLLALKTLTNFIKPDAAITLVGFKVPIQMVQWLKEQRVKTAVWFTEDPYFMDRTKALFRYFDFVFTIDYAALDYYLKNGHQHAYQLPLATEPKIFKPNQVETKYSSDICIVGFPYPDRVKYIQQLLQNTKYKILAVGKWRQKLYRSIQNRNLRIHEGWVEPAIVANYYNGTKIVLNTHRPFNLKQNQNRLGIVGKSINNKTFDAASCGAFQLIEFKEDLPNHFIEEDEMVSFHNYQELVEKIDFYMNNEVERVRIANNARERVLKDHTFEHRLRKMLEIINGSSI